MTPAALVATVQMERAIARLHELREQAPEEMPPARMTDRERRVCVRRLREADRVLSWYRSDEG